MIYELRTYTAVPGRLPDVIKRFSTVTLGFWKQYEIEYVDFWTTVIGESNQTLVYMLKWDSLADRDQKWSAFQRDPNWILKRAESEQQGQIVQNIHSSILARVEMQQ